MKSLYDQLNHVFDQKLCMHKQMKKQWKKTREALQECSIPVEGNDDIYFFRYEIVMHSLRVKARFEEVFFDVYVHMHDYWYDLTYQERKKQMNIDIDHVKQELIGFEEEGSMIYMPCFPITFNHLYTDEIVLLDLKQYHVFIRQFAQQIHHDLYGVKPYNYGFSSAQVVYQKGRDFILYHPLVHRFYRFVDNQFTMALSLDPRRAAMDEETLHVLADAFAKMEEDVLIEILLSHDLLSKRMKKKIHQYALKKAKKAQKQQKKEKQE